MSTSKAVPVTSTGPAAFDDAGQTGLILQLMKEVLNGRPPGTASVPSPTAAPSLPPPGFPAASLPAAKPEPGIPAIATVPRNPSLTGGLPQLPTGGSDDTGLAGGYPTASSPTHPPVHPLLPTAAPAPEVRGAPVATPSGAHDPAGQDGYAFGEPRCNGSVFRDPNGPSEKSAGHPPVSERPLDARSNPAPAFPDDSSDFKANVNYAVILSAAGMVANNKMTYPELRETLRPFLGKYIMMPAHPTTTDTLTTSSGITILGENKSGIKGTTITQSADKKTVLCFENFEFSDPIIISDYDKVRTRCGGKLAIVEINPYMDNIWILRLRITDAIIQKI